MKRAIVSIISYIYLIAFIVVVLVGLSNGVYEIVIFAFLGGIYFISLNFLVLDNTKGIELNEYSTDALHERINTLEEMLEIKSVKK